MGDIKSISGLLRGLGLCALVLASLIAMACLPAAAAGAQQMPNLPLPTLGGTQVWADEMVQAGWRAQRNVLTGHCRILDTDNARRAWGGCKRMIADFPAIAHKSTSGHLVLLVHGIARGPGTFGNLPQKLRTKGYDAVAISYPSTRATLQDHAAQLARIIRRAPDGTKVSFVTHSMGGLVVRQMFAGDQHWRQNILLGRVVMIAPPNQGSAVARFLKSNPAYAALYGKAGQQLVPDHVQKMPVPDMPFGIIAGGLHDDTGYNPLLRGDDDGTVAVAETRLKGAQSFVVLPGLHGIIARSSHVNAQVLEFLNTGSFGDRNG